LFWTVAAETAEAALAQAEAVVNAVDGFVVGADLLAGPGPLVIAILSELGPPVLADFRLGGSPRQVETAARRLAGLGARWVSVEASGGGTALAAAQAGLAAGGGAGLVAMVNVSPSRLARTAQEAGCEGVWCGRRDLAAVRQAAPGVTLFATASIDEVAEALARGAGVVIADGVGNHTSTLRRFREIPGLTAAVRH